MTETEDKEEEFQDSEDEGSEEDGMFRKRVTTVLVLVGGLCAGVASYFTLGFTSIVGAAPVVPISIVLLVAIKFLFDDFSAKKVPYVFLIVFFTWFIFGTFVLQLT